MNNNSKRDMSFFDADAKQDFDKCGKNKHDAISRKLSKAQL